MTAQRSPITLRSVTLGSITLAVSLLSISATASPVDSLGLGARSMAMGGAVAADATDFSATYYNPAELARAHELSLSLGYTHVAPTLRIDDQSQPFNDVNGFNAGFVAPGSIATLPVSFGLGLQLPVGHLSKVVTVQREQPEFVLYGNRLQFVHLGLGIAVRPWPWLTLGAGLAFMATAHGGFVIEGTAVQPVNGQSPYDSQLQHEINADLKTVRYPTFGATVLPSRNWALSLVYRDEAQVRLDLNTRLSGDLDLGTLSVPARYQLISQTVNGFVPRQLVFAASWSPAQRLTIDVDLTWQQWSGYSSPLSDSSSEFALEGTAAAPLLIPPMTSSTSAGHPRFRDRLNPRLGAEYLLELTAHWSAPLRAGYSFQPSPSPRSQQDTVFADADRHTFSLGTGIVWSNPGQAIWGDVGVDLFAFEALLPPRNFQSAVTGDQYRVSGSLFGAGLDLYLRMR